MDLGHFLTFVRRWGDNVSMMTSHLWKSSFYLAKVYEIYVRFMIWFVPISIHKQSMKHINFIEYHLDRISIHFRHCNIVWNFIECLIWAPGIWTRDNDRITSGTNSLKVTYKLQCFSISYVVLTKTMIWGLIMVLDVWLQERVNYTRHFQDEPTNPILG
jgi:hypothetical protein